MCVFGISSTGAAILAFLDAMLEDDRLYLASNVGLGIALYVCAVLTAAGTQGLLK
jgi:hypothetical protein